MRLPDRLLLITDRHTARQPLEVVLLAALEAGCRWILVREKDLDPTARRKLIARVLALAAPFGATVSISYDATLPLIPADTGLHLPGGVPVAQIRERYPTRLLGVSTHTLREASAAYAGGADYLTFGPVFASLSKPGYLPREGLAGLQAIAARLPIPVVALGGITPDNARACLAAGAQAVAVVGTVMQAGDPGRVVRELLAVTHGQRERS